MEQTYKQRDLNYETKKKKHATVCSLTRLSASCFK